MSEQAQARPDCEHHWVSHFQPDIPKILGWVSVCSQCGDINGAELCARLGEPRHASAEVTERVAYWTAIGRAPSPAVPDDTVIEALSNDRRLRPHAEFGDDPSGYCGCADCSGPDDTDGQPT